MLYYVQESHEYKYATLSRVRKFRVDGQDIKSTTTKIVDVKANRTLRDNKKFQQLRSVLATAVSLIRLETCLCGIIILVY